MRLDISRPHTYIYIEREREREREGERANLSKIRVSPPL
jgi:hypothetical protein